MRPLAHIRILAPLASLYALFIVAAGYSAMAAASCPSQHAVVIGFVGGFVRHDDLRHQEVQLARRLRSTYKDAVDVEIFENRHRKKAHRAILHFLDRDHDGFLSDEEKRSARIVLFGHSWGASAAVALARDLQREGIPVLLTVQVDSIAKIGQNDALIPANVAQAVNFYQTHGFFHGRARITAADSSRTQILGDVRLEYRKEPAQCRNYPWYDRLLFKDHTKIECDARLWSQVEELIRGKLPAVAEPVFTEYAQ
jgi:hypothetical protein